MALSPKGCNHRSILMASLPLRIHRIMLHERLQLYIADNAYTIVADQGGESLVIDRRTSSLRILSEALPPPSYTEVIPIHGIFGIVSLVATEYLIVITARQRVARILGTDVYKPTAFSIYPVSTNANITSPISAYPSEMILLGLVQAHLFSGPFYYTYGPYDVTSRLQAQAVHSPDRPLWERADDRFFWNKFLHQSLIEKTLDSSTPFDASRFILPAIFGFLEVKTTQINRHAFQWGLISRRDRYRAGTRYFSRGISHAGNVSNFNETEMLTLLDNDTTSSFSASSSTAIRGDIRASHVQIRGSVPVFWAEINNLKYKPTLKIMDLPDTAEAISSHFDNLISRYGDQYVANVVNSTGTEKFVKTAYEKALRLMNNPRVHYTYFDFHRECKGLRFDRVQILIDKFVPALEQQGYFFHDTTKTPQQPSSIQTSVIRTNCMDCLDRTNVVQSAIALHVLTKQLRQANILGSKENIQDHKEFHADFRNVWADNADVISKAYSGTGALKTDFTRSGIRTKEGAVQDGINSVIRYVKNNFLDGPRQDSYDLITGAWRPKKGVDVVFTDKRPVLTRIMPFFLFGAAITLTGMLIIGEYTSLLSSTLLFWASAVVASLSYIMKNGRDYVAWPRLISLDEIVRYQVVVPPEKQSRIGGVRSSERKESLTEIELGREKERTD